MPYPPPVLHILNINCFIVLFAIYFYSINFVKIALLRQRTTLMLGIIYSHYLYKLSIILISKLSKAQVCKWYRHKHPSPWGMQLGVVALWHPLLTESHKPKKTAIYLRRNIMKCRFWGGALRSFHWGTQLYVAHLWQP